MMWVVQLQRKSISKNLGVLLCSTSFIEGVFEHMEDSYGGRSAEPRILIVDDSEDMRFLLEQILEEEAYQLYFAEDGQGAIEQAYLHKPNLILMDMSLPGMSGWEVVSRLREGSEFEGVVIIALTAHVSKADQERALGVGCNAHLGKPFDVTEVLEIVERYLKQ
jgi:two-component system cell cycle response regulator DivK